jgi:protein-tyrosine phosphatase
VQNAGVELFAIDDERRLFISPAIDDWRPVEEAGITLVLDLEGGLDIGIPEVPNQLLYLYFPIYDSDLPGLPKLRAIARLGASLIREGEKVLSHCGMGFNRSALVAGLILVELGSSGKDAVALLREKRPGALFNETFAAYLESLPPGG